ncbi:MAG: universal stress protein [Desulfobacterales bacterium]|nr:universal stress protein [Desulfobacterales bacterium]
MKNSLDNKILLALDGSDYALNVVHYVCDFKPLHRKSIILFHVIGKFPELYGDFETPSQCSDLPKGIKVWEKSNQDKIQLYMNKAKQMLVESGIPEEAIRIKIQHKTKEIALDIINEAKKGYDALLIGRKGMSVYNEILVGGVATKIIDKLSAVPVLMIGTISNNKQILIAFDGSEKSFSAVGFTGSMAGGGDYKVNLLHVIRGRPEYQISLPILYLPIGYSKYIKKEVKSLFKKAKNILISKGFGPQQITAEIISDKFSRSVTIVREARKGNYGTIVIGRKGHSKVGEFLLGQVTQKIIRLISNRAVWII